MQIFPTGNVRLGLFFLLQPEHVISQSLPHLIRQTAAVSQTLQVQDQPLPNAALKLSLVWQCACVCVVCVRGGGGSSAVVIQSLLRCFNMNKYLSSNLGHFQAVLRLFFRSFPCSPPRTPFMHILKAWWHLLGFWVQFIFISYFFLHPLEDTFSGDICLSRPGSATEPLLWTFDFILSLSTQGLLWAAFYCDTLSRETHSHALPLDVLCGLLSFMNIFDIAALSLSHRYNYGPPPEQFSWRGRGLTTKMIICCFFMMKLAIWNNTVRSSEKKPCCIICWRRCYCLLFWWLFWALSVTTEHCLVSWVSNQCPSTNVLHRLEHQGCQSWLRVHLKGSLQISAEWLTALP